MILINHEFKNMISDYKYMVTELLRANDQIARSGKILSGIFQDRTKNRAT